MNEPSIQPQPPYLLAFELRKWMPDRAFRVYVNEQMISGAWVGGQWLARMARDEASFHHYRTAHWVLNWRWRQMVAGNIKHERLYEGVDPFGPSLTHIDRRNFQITVDQLVRVRFKHERLSDVPMSDGVIELRTFDGAFRRLVVVSEEHPGRIIERLRVIDRGLEVEGATTFQTLQERDISYARRDLLQSGLVGMCLGIVGALVCALNWIDDGRVAQAVANGSVIFLIFSGLGLFKALKMPRVNKPAQGGSES